MGERDGGYTVGQLMVIVLVAAIVLGLCIAMGEAVRRDRLTSFPPGPPRPAWAKEGKRAGFGDK